MSTSLLALKAGIGALVLGGTAASVAIGVFTTSSTQPTTLKKPSSVVVVNAAAGAVSSSATLTAGSDQKNYKCRLFGEETGGVACNLVKLNITNNWIDLAGIKKAQQAEAIKTEDINNSAHHFRLDVEEDLFEKIKLDSAKTIEIVSTDSTPVSLGKLDALFKIKNDAVEYEKTHYLLGKGGTDAASIGTASSYQCSTDAITSSDTQKACQFYAFGDSVASLSGAPYSNQVPSTLPGTALSAALTPHKYYLIHYTQAQTPTSIAGKNEVSVFLEESNSMTKKSTFNNVVPVILHGEASAQKAFILSETPTFSVVVKKAENIAESKTLTHNQTTKNYQCKLSTGTPSTPSNCNLVPLNFSFSTTSMKWDAVKSASHSGDLTINSSSATPTYYKVEVDATLFSEFSSGTISSKSIQIVEKPANGEALTVLLTLNPLFTIGDDDSVNFDKSTFIISGSSNDTSVSLTSSKERFCSFSTSGSAASSPKKCHITDLNATISASQDFKKDAEASSVVKTNTYLVHYTESGNKQGLDKADKVASSKFFLQEATDSETKSDIANFEYDKVIPAILVDSATAGSKYAFILK